MVAIAILGILAVTAVTAFRADPVGDAARQLNAVLHQARRTAVSGGPVRADVVAALGITCRAYVEVTTVGAATARPANVVRVYELVEDPLGGPTANWVSVTSVTLSADSKIYDVADEAYIGSAVGVVGDVGTDTVPADPPPAAAAATSFYPDGSSDGMTFFIGHRDDVARYDKYRVFVLPLSGLPTTAKYW